MDNLTTYSSATGLYNIMLTKADTELIIEVEKTNSLQYYSAKLNDDVVGEVTGKLFPKIDALFHGFIAALDKSEPNTKLSIGPDSKLNFCHKTMVGKIEIPISFSISLEEVQEDPLKRHERQITNLLNKVSELENQIKIMKRKDYMRITPVFDPDGSNNSSFTLSNYNKTSTRNSCSSSWMAQFAKDPLPGQGKFQFSVKIEKSGNTPGNIMIGVASGSIRTSPSCYNCYGSICMNICNNNIYYNEVAVVAINITLAYPGDVVTVLIDFEQDEILFKIEDFIIYRRKCELSQFSDAGLYPCIHSHNPNDCVTFL